DNSHDVIGELIEKNPAIKHFVNEKNSGQSVASYNGFLRSRGAYIIFLDADDFLYPACVEAHIRTHLSFRLQVGSTSVDMVQLVDERVVTTTSQGFSDFVRKKTGQMSDLLRQGVDVFDDPSGQLAGEIPAEAVHYVHPSRSNLWPWSPTSGNCF